VKQRRVTWEEEILAHSGMSFLTATENSTLCISINHLHQSGKVERIFPKDFVLHSPRHTMLTRLAECESRGQSSITVSQRRVYPVSEAGWREHLRAYGYQRKRRALTTTLTTTKTERCL